MPLRPASHERDLHAERREKELECVLRRAEEAGFFDECEENGAWEEKARELVPPGYRVVHGVCDSLTWWHVYWFSGG